MSKLPGLAIAGVLLASLPALAASAPAGVGPGMSSVTSSLPVPMHLQIANVDAQVDPPMNATAQALGLPPLPTISEPPLASISPDAEPTMVDGRPYYANADPAGWSANLPTAETLGRTVPWSIVVMLTALTLIPSILICMTPFARLLIVFHFLRQALGLQSTPSNQTLIGLSLILTFFLMQPVADQIYRDALVPMQSGQLTPIEALDRAEVPMHQFMGHYVREQDVALFVRLAKEPRPKSVNDLSMRVLLPAYILSELKAGFEIGTVLFLPFLVVDMVVASITTSVGMLQLPPVVISTPLKLLLFLMVDGWHLLIGSLLSSFH
ncbi:MAG: flagellar type III secretion system pore protein FliP [Acidobacteriaceae bacterium]